MNALWSSELADQFNTDGFVVVDGLIRSDLLEPLHARFEAMFRGEFETGIAPDEVNWQYETGDPSLTRQICNGWKADGTIASVVLDPRLGEAIASFGGWSGAQLLQDNMLWKPPGGRPLGFHRDNAYSNWLTPPEMITCWIALDDTAASTGTVEFVRGSHRWPDEPSVDVAFHGPADYRIPVRGHEADIVPIEVRAGSGSFHHGWTWHGSGVNTSDRHRRALVIHAVAVGTRFNRARLTEGNGALYGHYCAPDDDTLPIEHFPILWTAGADSPGLPAQ